MYQRIITVTFRDELTKASMTNYLQPIIKQQGEAYGLISMTSLTSVSWICIFGQTTKQLRQLVMNTASKLGTLCKRQAPRLKLKKAPWRAPGLMA